MRKPMCRQGSDSWVAQNHFGNTSRRGIAAVRSFHIGCKRSTDRWDLRQDLAADAINRAILLRLVTRRGFHRTPRCSNALCKGNP
jgi:hypothetical protein